MFIVRLIRKIFSLFRSKMTAHEVALGFCLGILMGCIPLSSVWMVAVVVLLALVFRTALSAFLAAALLVKALSFTVDPLLFRLGEAALEGPLQGFFAWAVNRPVLALLDLHRYVVAGGILFALLASLVCYPFFYFLTRRYRAAVLHWTETSPAFDRFTRFPLVRLLTWLLMGKKKGDYRETLELRRSPVRKKAVVLLVAFVAVICLFTALFGDAVAKAGFEGGLSRAMDADVSTRRLNLSFLHGSLNLEDFLVLEPEESSQIAKAVKFTGDLDVRQLLKRHLVFDEIRIENMDFHVERDEKGRLNLERKREAEVPEEEEPEEGGFDLYDLWEQKELARDVLGKVLDVLFPSEQEGDPEARREESKKEKIERKDYTALYADFLLAKNQPLIVIDDLWIKGLKLKLKDRGNKGSDRSFDQLGLHAVALSSNPALYGNDCLIEAGDNNLEDPAFHFKFNLNWSSPEPVHRLELRLNELPLEQVLACLDPGDRLGFEGGTVALESETLFEKEGIQSNNRIRIQGVNVTSRSPGGKILGLDGDLFARGLTEFLKESPLETVVSLSGPYGRLKIDVDDMGLIESVKEGVRRTGDRLLQEQFNEQVDRARALAEEKMGEAEKRLEGMKSELEDKLKEKVGEKLGEELGKELEGILKGKEDEKKGLLDGVGGLLGGKGKKKQEEEKKKEGGGLDP
jgi:uncharacterized protein (TIGR03546 family)